MVQRLLVPLTEPVYFCLRVISGLLFTFHGLQKVFGLYSDHVTKVGSELWIGGVIELAAGLLIAVGFMTVIAAFIASGEMAVAYFQFHWKFQMGAAFFPVVNKGELAALYCFVFLFIATKGAGIWSIDGRSKR